MIDIKNICNCFFFHFNFLDLLKCLLYKLFVNDVNVCKILNSSFCPTLFIIWKFKLLAQWKFLSNSLLASAADYYSFKIFKNYNIIYNMNHKHIHYYWLYLNNVIERWFIFQIPFDNINTLITIWLFVGVKLKYRSLILKDNINVQNVYCVIGYKYTERH